MIAIGKLAKDFIICIQIVAKVLCVYLYVYYIDNIENCVEHLSVIIGPSSSLACFNSPFGHVQTLHAQNNKLHRTNNNRMGMCRGIA